jgi:hypothetical protein
VPANQRSLTSHFFSDGLANTERIVPSASPRAPAVPGRNFPVQTSVPFAEVRNVNTALKVPLLVILADPARKSLARVGSGPEARDHQRL